jgi:hypothetical protein
VPVTEVSQNHAVDSRGRRSGNRTYRVSGVAPAALRENPSTYGLPSPGSTWEGMTADSITISTAPVASTAYDASVNYSDNGAWRFPERRDESAGDFATESGGTYSEELMLPMYWRVVYESPPPVPGNPPIETIAWQPIEKPISENRERFVRRVTVQGIDLGAAKAGFRSQLNKIHTIGGRNYLFVGATYSERDAGVFDFEYSWEYDPGTPYPDGAGSFAFGPALPGPYIASGAPWTPGGGPDQFCRSPYHAIEIGERATFGFTHYRRYPIEANGYLQLVNVGIPPP